MDRRQQGGGRRRLLPIPPACEERGRAFRSTAPLSASPHPTLRTRAPKQFPVWESLCRWNISLEGTQP
jgi:hypothetical protein